MKKTKQIWLSIGIGQLLLIVVCYHIMIKDQISPYTINSYNKDLYLVLSTVIAVALGLVGQVLYKKALTHSDEKQQNKFFIISWVLAEAITLIGIVGIYRFWTEVENSVSFWISGIILWAIRYPK